MASIDHQIERKHRAGKVLHFPLETIPNENKSRLGIKSCDMRLTPKQQEMLRAIAPGLEQGTVGDTVVFLKGGDRITGFFIFPDDGNDSSWRQAWNGITETDIRVFAEADYLLWIEDDRYALDTQAIVDTVRSNFQESLPAPASVINCQHSIFVSYSHDDVRIAEELADFLKKAYDNVWYDKVGLRGGQQWLDEILKQVAACDVFIFLLSNESLASTYCLQELDEAKRLQKYIVPIRVRRQATNISEWLKAIQIIDMSASRIDTEPLNDLYVALIRHTSPSKVAASPTPAYPLTDEARRWAKLLVNLWTDGKLDQTFTLLEVTAGNDRTISSIYGVGLIDDTVRETPPIGVVRELADAGLIKLTETNGHSRRWEVTLTAKLKSAIDT